MKRSELNIKRLNKYSQFQNSYFFDENFFMYLENDDLCKRIIDKNEEVFFKYIPQKTNKKIFNKKSAKENPFGILKNLNLN